MISKTMSILIALLLVTSIVYAHGPEGDDGGDDVHVDATSETFLASISIKQQILLSAGVAGSLLFTGVLWWVTGRQMPAILMVATFLTALTGLIHLAVGRNGEWLLLANGIGYCAIAIVRILPRIQLSPLSKWITIGLVAYTVVTIAGYILTHDHYDIVGISSKVIEVLLLVVLARQLLSTDDLAVEAGQTSISPVTG